MAEIAPDEDAGDRLHRRVREVAGDRGLADINYALSTGALNPTIAAIYDLNDIALAHEHVETARVPGNVVVRIR